MTVRAAQTPPSPHEGPVCDRVAGYDVIDCRGCGFRHVVPLPDAAALEAQYREAYYRDAKPDYLARAAADQAWARLAQVDRLELCAAHLPQGRRALIDIGAGPGFFLRTARDLGWTVLGVEPSAQAAAHARALGLEIREGFFGPELSAGLPASDLVHLHHVLEHVPDPAAILRLARGLLRPDGLICVTVPNDYNALQQALREAEGYAPWWLAPPHHLNYFDFDALARLLRRTGFTPLETTTSFPMELFLLMGETYVGDDAAGRRCHGRRVRLEQTLERARMGAVRRRLYQALAGIGLGRDATILARRTGAEA